jgi:hypothetical protein
MPDQVVPSTARVEVKSAWLSKVNWTQAVALLAAWLGAKGISLDAETQVQIVLGVQAAQSVVTWIFRTWFNKSVTPASL